MTEEQRRRPIKAEDREAYRRAHAHELRNGEVAAVMAGKRDGEVRRWLAYSVRRCPECLALVDTSKDWRKMFCSNEHRTAYHNRQTVRGRKLVPLVMAERITRSGYCRDKDAGKLARQKSRQLMDLWNREDREAGRMAADEYIAIRQKLGLNDADTLGEGEAARRRDAAIEGMTDAELLKALQETRSDSRLEKLRAERRRRDKINQGRSTD